MILASLLEIQSKILEVLVGLAPSFIGGALVFTALSLLSNQACNSGKSWWRNRGLFTDLCYLLITPFFAPYLAAAAAILVAMSSLGSISIWEIKDYIEQGRGPLSGLPFYAKCVVYLLLSDFLLYWSHRLFHRPILWPYHAIHHSAEDVDWTTSFRVHPINLLLGAYLVTSIMIYLGISLETILLLAPFDTAYAYFVHANLNWTLGPLKYVIATPVFHRWHHTAPDKGGNANFAPLFAFWDVIFGTFYMPQSESPERYGVSDERFPQGYLGQLFHPFRGWVQFPRRRPGAVPGSEP
jgi:sterol desaturase/sphingolipid hydroxylase (fatty acid hydroxylase superfamily)